jgi:alpha-beta hydrolase superfamily lysophospholipase
VSSSETFWITTADHLKLLGRRWPVPKPDRAGAALLIHGVGEHSGRYDHVAAVMRDAHIEVVSYDQRGFGASEGTKGCIPTPTSLVDDAAMVFRMVAAENVTTPFLVAHSMGGAVAAYAVTSGAIAPRGLVLSSPAIRPRIDHLREALLRGLLKDHPDLQLHSMITPEEVTHDPDVQQAIRTDSLMHTIVSPRLIISMIDEGRAALADASKVAAPALFLVAGDDKLVDPKGSRDFANAIPADVTFHEFPGLFHEVFNERPPDRKKVLDAFADWLTGQVGP